MMRSESLKFIITLAIIYNLVTILYKILNLKIGTVGGVVYLLIVFLLGFFIYNNKFNEQD